MSLIPWSHVPRRGGIHPIAIGSTLRRLVAKVGCRSVVGQMKDYLSPLQLGFGTKLGAEAAIHSARKYLREIPANSVLVKLDFKNAFNSIRRDVALRACLVHIPELYPLVYSCYSSCTHLFYAWRAYSPISGRCVAGRPFGSFTLLSCGATSGGKATI